MKKRKLSCLLALVACLSMPLAACDEEEKTAGQILNEHFIWDDAKASYTKVETYEGTIQDVDSEHNLIAISSEKPDYSGSEMSAKQTVQVIDMLSGKVIFETYVSNFFGAPEAEKDILTVTIDYPVIKVEERRYSSSNNAEPYSYYYTYQWAKRSNEHSSYYYDDQIHINDSTANNLVVNKHYSLYEVKVGNKVFWVNEDLDILREFNVAQTGDYGTTTISGETKFNGAYDDYLYSWANGVIQVFNREGVPTVQYTYPGGTAFLSTVVSCAILNNGNIFVQELSYAEADEVDYTFKAAIPGTYGYENKKVNVVNKIIDYKTGEVKEVALDYVVLGLEAAYVEDVSGQFPMGVRDGDQNQAYIAKIANKEVTTVDYVTMDNEGKIGYALQNDLVKQSTTAPLVISMGYPTWSMYKVNDQHYAAQVSVAGKQQTWWFDAAGNKVAVQPDGMRAYTDAYMVTENSIFDYNCQKLYDFGTSPFFNTDQYRNVDAEVVGNKIYLTAVNVLTREQECYEFDGKDFVKVAEKTVEIEATDNDRIPEGNKATVELPFGNVQYSSGIDSYTWTLYAEDGTALIKTQVDDIDESVLTVCKDVAYMEKTVDGKNFVYVAK